MSKLASLVILEDSKEQSGDYSNNYSSNNKYDEMAMILMEQQKTKQSNKKRQKFAENGRGKSAVLPERPFFSGERDISKRKTYEEG